MTPLEKTDAVNRVATLKGLPHMDVESLTNRVQVTTSATLDYWRGYVDCAKDQNLAIVGNMFDEHKVQYGNIIKKTIDIQNSLTEIISGEEQRGKAFSEFVKQLDKIKDEFQTMTKTQSRLERAKALDPDLVHPGSAYAPPHNSKKPNLQIGRGKIETKSFFSIIASLSQRIQL